jgi:coenzyme PQQ synthesis protein D (PqqD)
MSSGQSFSTIGENTLITRRSGLLAAAVREETIMMDIESGQYYGLDDIGSEIWQRLESPRKFGDLIDGLVTEYDADRSVIAEDVRKLLSIMAEHKVVTLS